jgi:outer membrane beta-barrel protein
MKNTATTRRILAGLAAAFGLLAATETAQAQEILLTGPLAGAPAVRKLRLYRQGRFQVTPHATFTLLDKFQQTILPGLQLDYNFTDWLAVGVYGAFAPEPLHLERGLTKKIQKVNEDRDCRDENTGDSDSTTTDCRLTAINLGPEFADQLGQIDWIAAPQITGVPFRGKLALFRSIYVDTELYFFAGAGVVGLKERVDCGEGDNACSLGASFERESRIAIGPTAGLGFTFWVNKWNGLNLQYRLLPFRWNIGGFDTAGGDPDGDFPDAKISKKDRAYVFNQLLTVGWSFYFPTQYRISE